LTDFCYNKFLEHFQSSK